MDWGGIGWGAHQFHWGHHWWGWKGRGGVGMEMSSSMPPILAAQPPPGPPGVDCSGIG
jgi:hypothetical protein